MKKRLVFKIILNLVLIISTFILTYWFIKLISQTKGDFLYVGSPTVNQELIKKIVIQDIFTIILYVCNIICNVVIFFLLNFKDISYLCGSVIKDIKEHKDSTAEARKQKRIESLEKELEELKSDSNKDNM